MKLPHLRTGTVTLLLIALATPLAAQGAAPPPACSAAEFRQFDFWVGQWNVTVGGKQAGTNRITREEGGCLIHEQWLGAGGSTGQSLNFYDRTDQRWHQVWVDNGGNVLRLSGTLVGNELRFTGVAPGPDGKPNQQRLTFFNNSDGTVRQLWEASADGERTWTVAFDGLYRRAP